MISQPSVINTEALEEVLASHPDKLRLVHVASADAFVAGHIPGALQVPPAELVSGTPPAVGRLPNLDRLNALFSRLGYTPDCDFVLYDDEGGGWAGRFGWTLDTIGHRSWRYLDGGLIAWNDAGLPVVTDAAAPVRPSPVALQLDPEPIATLQDVRDAIDDPDQIIWDVRSREEYLGQKSGSVRAGHIPGAVNLDWHHLKDPSRALRLTQNLQDLLAAHGVDGRKSIITHCQSHHRSGLSYMVGRLLGFQRIRAYDGAWAEWGNLEDTPIDTGD